MSKGHNTMFKSLNKALLTIHEIIKIYVAYIEANPNVINVTCICVYTHTFIFTF